jgi:hypothetical protein
MFLGSTESWVSKNLSIDSMSNSFILEATVDLQLHGPITAALRWKQACGVAGFGRLAGWAVGMVHGNWKIRTRQQK